MDRKTAIEWIEQIKHRISGGDEVFDRQRKEALDMAIVDMKICDANNAGWISVKGRLPEEKQSEITYDFEYVLCATTFGDVRPYKFGKPIGWKEPHFWHGSGLMDKYVTHWMPLPEPPKEET